MDGVLKTGGQSNRTKIEQDYIEDKIMKIYDQYKSKQLEHEHEEEETEGEVDESGISHYLLKDFHGQYLYFNLHNVGKWGRAYDNGQPWMIYWICHAMDVLGHEQWDYHRDGSVPKCLKFLSYCQNPEGGFCGGPNQILHVASSYAAILSIIIMGEEEGYKMVNREGMYKFLMKMRNPKIKGSFFIHEKGECDMRGAYIAMVIADVLNIMTDELKASVGDYIASLQTYEGGIAATPNEEAHGGYTFCGFACLCLLNEAHKVDLNKLTYWAVNRQLPNEGGFNGRTNKVVDACYTFWIGALFQLINLVTGNKCSNQGRLLCDQLRVQEYVLLCGQDHEDGGMRDKPGKASDYYHSCYALSGLSICQSLIGSDKKLFYKDIDSNRLNEVDPIFNVDKAKLAKAREYFRSLPPIKV